MLLPLFGIYTRLTGKALNGSACWCTLSASLALACGVSTTSPSTPAVIRPALRSVTRRTLTSVFARDRSINFCRLRTFFRSPAFDAVKIRCRSRRTSSSTRRQSTACQSKSASSGPFTTTFVAASNLSSGSGALVIFLLTGSPDRVSALSGRTIRVRIRPVIRGDQLEELANLSRFPVAFRPPAFASRSSDSRRGVGPSLRSAYRTRSLIRTPTGLPRSTRASCDRDGCPLCPEDGGAHPGTEARAQPAPAAPPRLVPKPRSNIPSSEASFHEASDKGSRHSPVRSSPNPRPPGQNEPPLGLSPELRTPPTKSQRRTSRWGQANKHGPGTTRSTSHPLILQSVVHSRRATSRRNAHSETVGAGGQIRVRNRMQVCVTNTGRIDVVGGSS